MKHLLFTVLENNRETHDLIRELSKKGYNGTVLSSTSLKHVLEDEHEDTLSFISLSHIHENRFVQNTTIYFILEEKELEEVQTLIREFTKNFTLVKGGMFVAPIDSYEGSF